MKKLPILPELKRPLIFWSAIILVVSTSFSCSKKKEIKNQGFRFNLSSELKSLDPLLVRGSAKRFLLFNLHRGLFFYGVNSQLQNHGAQNCKGFSGNRIFKCGLSPKKFNDGTLIESKHYLNAFIAIKKLQEESLELLQNIKEIKAPAKQRLEFYLKKPDPVFLERLADPSWVPRKEPRVYINSKSMAFSGPYQLKEKSLSRVVIENNPYYDSKKRPLVTAIYVDEPSTALKLYETKRLDFLRYLETQNIKTYKDLVFLSPISKLDGLFINPLKIPDLMFRKALAESLKYPGLQKIFSSKGIPGCIGVTKEDLGFSLPCYFFNQEHLSSTQMQSLKRRPQKIKFSVPLMEHNDHKRLAEWLQQEWQKNLGIQVEIDSIESRAFYKKARALELEVYRKSVPLYYLNCLHAQERLEEQKELKKALGPVKSKGCKDFFNSALKTYVWIPLGIVHVPHLHAQNYKGYYINRLDQFGLENLEEVK